jgi:hypothetical protein
MSKDCVRECVREPWGTPILEAGEPDRVRVNMLNVEGNVKALCAVTTGGLGCGWAPLVVACHCCFTPLGLDGLL